MTMTAIELPMEKIPEFCDRWQVTEFALFGSVLRDDFRPDSDIDVLVTFSPTLRQQHPEVPWREMVGMRDVIVREYDQLDFDVICGIWFKISCHRFKT